MAERSDDELVRRTRGGDPEAFAELVSRHRRSAYSAARRLVADPEAAEDVAQETFVRAYSKLSTYRPGGSFVAWLLTIATRLGIDHLRRNRHREAQLPQEADGAERPLPDEGPGPEQVVLGRATTELVERAIARLPSAQRAAVTLRHVHDMPYEEIAAAMEGPEGTAKSHVHRGRRTLRRLLAPYVEEQP